MGRELRPVRAIEVNDPGSLSSGHLSAYSVPSTKLTEQMPGQGSGANHGPFAFLHQALLHSWPTASSASAHLVPAEASLSPQGYSEPFILGHVSLRFPIPFGTEPVLPRKQDFLPPHCC